MNVTEVLEIRMFGLKTSTTGWALKTDHGVFVIAVEDSEQRGASRTYPSLDAMRADPEFGGQAHFEPWNPEKLPAEMRSLILESALLASRTAQAVVERYIAGTMTAGRYCDE